MGRATKFAPEVRERAVRMVLEPRAREPGAAAGERDIAEGPAYFAQAELDRRPK